MMTKLSEINKQIYLQERDNKIEGRLNGIPLFYTFPKLGSIVHSIPKGYPILWTANSGIGKTTSWIGIILYSIYKLKRDYPELNIKVKLIIALLEDTKEMFIDRLFCMFLSDMYKMDVDVQDLHSLKENPISEDIISKLDEVQKEIDFILEDCEINDSVYNPTGLYKWARTITSKYGKHHTKKMIFTREDGSQHEEDVYSHYEQEDNSMQFLMVVDNLNNLAQEMRAGNLLTERETINLWTRSYCRLQITKHWKWSVINVIQQASDSESTAYYNGKLIVDKVKPSLSGLGNSKECQRDHFMVIGLFAPDRYAIGTYEGYDISIFRDNFRSIIILKSNISKTNVEVPMLFKGGQCRLIELPRPEETTEIIKVYKYLDKIKK
jgi:hypothetical protein